MALGKPLPTTLVFELAGLSPSGEEGLPHRGLIQGSHSRRNAAKPAPLEWTVSGAPCFRGRFDVEKHPWRSAHDHQDGSLLEIVAE